MKTKILVWALMACLATPAIAYDWLTTMQAPVENRLLSIGICSYSESAHPLAAAAYFNFCPLTFFDDHLRIGVGMLGGYDDGDVLFKLHTSVSTRIFDSLEVGVWYAPFWGLSRYEDPYGVMVGYVFKL